ncbi:hypothetical protein ILUMI_13931 [Ignelater luminosus]|uniref:Craniofacial development protein 2 n=1 Tax=Ignelater luminosus TaxID=2038154 RepID=A0A8K0CVT8_IGNLU|nr:hypothetical protein ILUMI_13931 [Ignelater luminosus]
MDTENKFLILAETDNNIMKMIESEHQKRTNQKKNQLPRLVLEINKTAQLQIIQVCAPAQSYEDEKVEHFYEQISTAADCKTQNKIIIGDLNAKLGTKQDDNEQRVGKSELGEINRRGEMVCLHHASFVVFNKAKPASRKCFKTSNNIGKTIHYFDEQSPIGMDLPPYSTVGALLYPSRAILQHPPTHLLQFIQQKRTIKM